MWWESLNELDGIGWGIVATTCGVVLFLWFVALLTRKPAPMYVAPETTTKPPPNPQQPTPPLPPLPREVLIIQAFTAGLDAVLCHVNDEKADEVALVIKAYAGACIAVIGEKMPPPVPPITYTLPSNIGSSGNARMTNANIPVMGLNDLAKQFGPNG